VKAAEGDPARNIIIRDDEVIGFGVRVTKSNAQDDDPGRYTNC
jgi:hypothetical protein